MNIIPLPAPIHGLNITAIAPTLPPEEAISLVNWFPERNYLRVRDGISVYTNLKIGVNKDISSLFLFTNEGGSTVKLIVGSNSQIVDVSSSTPATIALPGGYSITNDSWETTGFVDSGGTSYSVLCNGTNTPLMFNGTTLATSAWTGVTQTLLTKPLSYKGRLYFIEKDSLSIWYGSTGVSGASSSALTKLNLASIFSLSGKIIYHGSWSFDFGNGLHDYYAVVTSEGEFLVYSGIYPGDVDGWGLLSRGLIAKPVGSRCFAKYGNDILVLCQDGEIYSFSSFIQKNWQSVSIKIAKGLKDLLSATFTTCGEKWSVFISQKHGKIYVVCPTILTAGVISATKLYVGNLNTRDLGYIPWCEYSGVIATCMCVYGPSIYYGSIDGYIYKAETSLRYDYKYVSGTLTIQPIYTRLCTAPRRHNTTMNGRTQFLMVKPLFVGSGDIKYDIGIEINMESRGVLSVDGGTATSADSGTWNVDHWNVAQWGQLALASSKWRRVTGLGTYGNVRMEALFANSLVQLAEIAIGVKDGGF